MAAPLHFSCKVIISKVSLCLVCEEVIKSYLHLLLQNFVQMWKCHLTFYAFQSSPFRIDLALRFRKSRCIQSKRYWPHLPWHRTVRERVPRSARAAQFSLLTETREGGGGEKPNHPEELQDLELLLGKVRGAAAAGGADAAAHHHRQVHRHKDRKGQQGDAHSLDWEKIRQSQCDAT